MPELTEANVRARIASTQRKNALTFAASLAVLIGGGWIFSESTGPAAEVVLFLASAIGGIGALIFGGELLMLPGHARRAIRDLPHYRDDPEGFERMYGSIMDFRVAMWGRERTR